MPRTQTRDIERALRAAEIDETKPGPKVSDNIQLTYQLDDLSHLVPAIAGVRGFYLIIVAAVVALRGIVEVAPPPDSSIVIEYWENLFTSNIVYSVGDSRLDGNIGARPPVFTTGGTPRSIVRDGTASGVVVAGLSLLGSQERPVTLEPLVVIPGQVMRFTDSTPNEAFTIGFNLLEIRPAS